MIRNRLLMGVAVFAAALLGISALQPAQDLNAAMLGRMDLPSSVAMPLPNDDRLPDLTSPGVIIRMLPSQSADDSPMALDNGIMQSIAASQAGNAEDSDTTFLAFSTEEVYYSPYLRRGVALPSADLVAFHRPTPIKPTLPFVSDVRLNITALAESATVSVPIPTSKTIVPVDFTSLLNDEGNITFASRAADERDVLLDGGRFGLGTLELGHTQDNLEIDEVQLAVADSVHLFSKGRIITHIRSAPAGLDFAEDATLEVRRGAKIVLLWYGAPTVNGIHWGMRAVGDWRQQFRFLIDSGRIIVGKLEYGSMAISKAVVIYDGFFTYITIDIPVYDKPINSWAIERRRDEIPEPASIILVSLGGLVALKRRRQRFTTR